MHSRHRVSPLLCFYLFAAVVAQDTPQFCGLTIRRTGGFVGSDEEWCFSEKGVRWKPEGDSVRIPAGQVRRLKELVARNYKGRKSEEVSVPLCFDCFTFRVTVWYDDGSQVLEISEAGGPPDSDRKELLRLIRELTGEYRPKP